MDGIIRTLLQAKKNKKIGITPKRVMPKTGEWWRLHYLNPRLDLRSELRDELFYALFIEKRKQKTYTTKNLLRHSTSRYLKLLFVQIIH